MQIIHQSFSTRCKFRREQLRDELQREIRIKSIIDFINSLPWVKHNKVMTGSVSYSWINMGLSDLEIFLDQVNLDNLVEGLLGPIHREFDVNWNLYVQGSVNNPIYQYNSTSFKDLGYFVLVIKATEGQFKSCKVVETVTERVEKRTKLSIECT